MASKDQPAPVPPPDPAALIQLQQGANLSAANLTGNLNRVPITGPFGSVSYSETGDPFAPYKQTIALDPAEQAKLDQQRALDMSLFGTARTQADQIGDRFATPFSLAGLPAAPVASDAVRQRVEDSLMKRIRPRFEEQDAALRARLAGQGIGAGSEAYNKEIDALNRARNDARFRAVEAGGAEQSRLFALEQAARNQGINERLTERNQPLSELAATLGNVAGPNVPQFGLPPGVQVPPADALGAALAAYQGAVQQHGADSAAAADAKGALFDLFGTGASLFLGSDLGKSALGGLGSLFGIGGDAAGAAGAGGAAGSAGAGGAGGSGASGASNLASGLSNLGSIGSGAGAFGSGLFNGLTGIGPAGELLGTSGGPLAGLANLGPAGTVINNAGGAGAGSFFLGDAGATAGATGAGGGTTGAAGAAGGLPTGAAGALLGFALPAGIAAGAFAAKAAKRGAENAAKKKFIAKVAGKTIKVGNQVVTVQAKPDAGGGFIALTDGRYIVLNDKWDGPAKIYDPRKGDKSLGDLSVFGIANPLAFKAKKFNTGRASDTGAGGAGRGER